MGSDGSIMRGRGAWTEVKVASAAGAVAWEEEVEVAWLGVVDVVILIATVAAKGLVWGRQTREMVVVLTIGEATKRLLRMKRK